MLIFGSNLRPLNNGLEKIPLVTSIQNDLIFLKLFEIWRSDTFWQMNNPSVVLAVGLLLGSTQSTLVPGKHQFWFFDSTNYNNAGTLLVLSTMLMTHYWLSVHVDCKVGRQKAMGCLALILPHGWLAMLSSYSTYARDKKMFGQFCDQYYLFCKGVPCTVHKYCPKKVQDPNKLSK